MTDRRAALLTVAAVLPFALTACLVQGPPNSHGANPGSGGSGGDVGGKLDDPGPTPDAGTAPTGSTQGHDGGTAPGSSPDLAPATGNPPSGSGTATGSGSVASWTACWVLDNYYPDSDNLYHQGMSYNAAQDYIVLGASWNAPGCNGSPDDTFNDFADVLPRSYLWWFTHFPNYKYVKYTWVDSQLRPLQDSGCIDYNALGPCN